MATRHPIADPLIKHLGGSTAVSKMLGVPVSTVHSWRSNGIPHWRLDRVRDLAADHGVTVPESAAS